MTLRPLLALLLLLGCYAAPVAPPPQRERTPAAVLSPAGVEWLEREERDQEERPELVLAAMNLKNGDVVADVGAGSGYYTRRLARAVAPNGMVYANDVQPGMIEALKKNIAAARLTNVIPILGTTTDPKLPLHTMDWILLVDVYHEFQEPEAMLASLRQTLKPNGRVALVEYREDAGRVHKDHRMSKEQVLREWLPAGFKIERILETMPNHRIYIFSLHG